MSVCLFSSAAEALPGQKVTNDNKSDTGTTSGDSLLRHSGLSFSILGTSVYVSTRLCQQSYPTDWFYKPDAFMIIALGYF